MEIRSRFPRRLAQVNQATWKGVGESPGWFFWEIMWYSFTYNHRSWKWLYLKGNYYWRAPCFTSMIMGGRVFVQMRLNTKHCRNQSCLTSLVTIHWYLWQVRETIARWHLVAWMQTTSQSCDEQLFLFVFDCKGIYWIGSKSKLDLNDIRTPFFPRLRCSFGGPGWKHGYCTSAATIETAAPSEKVLICTAWLRSLPLLDLFRFNRADQRSWRHMGHCCVDPFLTDFVLRGCKTAQFMQELSSARGTALLSES